MFRLDSMLVRSDYYINLLRASRISRFTVFTVNGFGQQLVKYHQYIMVTCFLFCVTGQQLRTRTHATVLSVCDVDPFQNHLKLY